MASKAFAPNFLLPSPGSSSSFKFHVKCPLVGQCFPGQADSITTFSNPLLPHLLSRWKLDSCIAIDGHYSEVYLRTVRWRSGRKSMFLKFLFDFRRYIVHFYVFNPLNFQKLIEVNGGTLLWGIEKWGPKTLILLSKDTKLAGEEAVLSRPICVLPDRLSLLHTSQHWKIHSTYAKPLAWVLGLRTRAITIGL